MIAVGYRLTKLEDLLTLLPLTAETDYVQWFSLTAQHIMDSGKTCAVHRRPDGTVQRILGDESPLSAELLNAFKVGVFFIHPFGPPCAPHQDG